MNSVPEAQRITLRIPVRLHKRLTGAALQSFHSMNAEIIARLEASFAENDTKQKDDLVHLLKSVLRSIE